MHDEQFPIVPYVRIAELEVDPAQMESFRAAIREVGSTSVQKEPGCLALYAVSERDAPTCVRVFEIYRDADAYQARGSRTSETRKPSG